MSKLAPVVIIHGMWSTPDALVDLKASFEDQGYEVHTPRLPNHYARKDLDEARKKALATTRVEDYVNSVCAYIETLDQAPILVGHSMGGLIVQLVAARLPIEKLILISSAAPAGINSWGWSVIRTFGHNLRIFPLWKKTTYLLLKNIQYGIANSQSPAIQEDIIRKSTFESGLASTQIGMWFLFRKPPTRVNYENISCPVFIVSGTEDRITPLHIQYKIAQKYGSQATLKAVKGACHWTLGGSYFPQITQHIFNWLQPEQNLKNAA